MHKLRPTFWRTCRAIAHETRLRLLWEIFKGNERSVTDLGRIVGISEPTASIQLRTLSSRGLICPVRGKLNVVYYPEANSELEHVEKLLNALRHSFANEVSFETVIHQATAFTHLRRILIVQALSTAPMTFGKLMEETGVAAPALARHLRKLEARHFVKKRGKLYGLAQPQNLLGKALLEIACA